MNYILSCAPIISPVALEILKTRKNVTIITSSVDVKKFCLFFSIPYIFFEIPKIGVNYPSNYYSLLKYIFRIPKKIVQMKKILDDLIKRIPFIENDKLYLVTTWIAYDNFYIAREIANKMQGNVFLYGIRWQKISIGRASFNVYSFPRYIFKFILKVYFNLDLNIYKTWNGLCFGIDDKFLKKNGIIKLKQNLSFVQYMKKILDNNTFQTDEHDHLLIGEGPNVLSRNKTESLMKVYKTISSLNTDLIIKKHPSAQGKTTEFDKLMKKEFKSTTELPQFVPVELYFNSTRKCVIAIGSTPLVLASNLSHLKAISLLELVEWHKEDVKNSMKKDLIEMSNNKIIFVRSHEHLKHTLLN